MYYTKEITELLENRNIQKSKLNKFLEYYLKKYFTKKQLEKLNEIIKIFTIKEYNREILIECLEKLNKNRNDMVHKLFDIENIDVLKKKLNEYDELSEEAIELLLEYYNAICERLIKLDGRVDFKSLI